MFSAAGTYIKKGRKQKKFAIPALLSSKFKIVYMLF